MRDAMTIEEIRDREDSQKAVNFYVKARTEHNLLPLEIILGLWPTPNWSDRSKELFLEALSKGLKCDRGTKRFTAYTRHTIESYLVTRARGMGSSSREYDE